MAGGDSLPPPDWRESAALEKYLKGYLLARGWALRKIHQLQTLLYDAIRNDRSPEPYQDLCERVSGYYFVERYPQLVRSGLTAADIEVDRAEARRLIGGLFPDERLS